MPLLNRFSYHLLSKLYNSSSLIQHLALEAMGGFAAPGIAPLVIRPIEAYEIQI